MTPASEDQTRTIEIPRSIAEAIGNRIEDTEFDSIDDYSAFVLDRVLWELRRLDREEDGTETEHSPSKEADSSEDDIAERLEALGYL